MALEIHEVFSALIFRLLSLQKATSNKIPISAAALSGRSHYRGTDKSLARPTSRCIFFGGENIPFDVSLFICRNITNIPPIMIINRISGVLISPKPDLLNDVFCLMIRIFRLMLVFFYIYIYIHT